MNAEALCNHVQAYDTFFFYAPLYTSAAVVHAFFTYYKFVQAYLDRSLYRENFYVFRKRISQLSFYFIYIKSLYYIFYKNS